MPNTSSETEDELTEHQLVLFGDTPAVAARARADPAVNGSNSSNGVHAGLTLGEAA